MWGSKEGLPPASSRLSVCTQTRLAGWNLLVATMADSGVWAGPGGGRVDGWLTARLMVTQGTRKLPSPLEIETCRKRPAVV